jgi:Tfp pilus assembly protein PilW
MSADVIMDGAPDIEPLQEREITVILRRSRNFGDDPMNVNMRWWLPEGFTLVSGRKTTTIPARNAHTDGTIVLKYKIKAGENVDSMNRCVLEVMPTGRCTTLYVPVVYLG